MAKALPNNSAFADVPKFDEHTEIARPPRKKVLLLTCMDYRLLDNVVKFMNSMNLENRYDQLVFAGAAMGVHRLPVTPPNEDQNLTPDETPYAETWARVFFDHLSTAINALGRDIHDIFIIEHLDCGAYRVAHPCEHTRTLYAANMDIYAKGEKGVDDAIHNIKRLHCRECFGFADRIRAFCDEQEGAQWEKINVRCFIMDLAGKVTELTPKKSKE